MNAFKILATGAAVAVSSLIFTPSASAQTNEQVNCGCTVSSTQEYETVPFRHQVKVKHIVTETKMVPIEEKYTTTEWETRTIRYQVEVRPVEVCGCSSTRPAEYEWRTKEETVPVQRTHTRIRMVPQDYRREVEDTEWRTDNVRVLVKYTQS